MFRGLLPEDTSVENGCLKVIHTPTAIGSHCTTNWSPFMSRVRASSRKTTHQINIASKAESLMPADGRVLRAAYRNQTDKQRPVVDLTSTFRDGAGATHRSLPAGRVPTDPDWRSEGAPPASTSRLPRWRQPSRCSTGAQVPEHCARTCCSTSRSWSQLSRTARRQRPASTTTQTSTWMCTSSPRTAPPQSNRQSLENRLDPVVAHLPAKSSWTWRAPSATVRHRVHGRWEALQ